MIPTGSHHFCLIAEIDHNRLCMRIDPRTRRALHLTTAIPVGGTACFGRRRGSPTLVGVGRSQTMSTTPTVVDIHPSVFPTELPKRSGDSTYPRSCSLTVGEDSIRIIVGQSTFRQMRRMQCDVAARLAELDVSGVGLQPVSTSAGDQSYADGSAMKNNITFFEVMILPLKGLRAGAPADG
jgi:hypothetical protein